MSNPRTPSPASEGPGSCSIIITGLTMDAVEQHMADDTAIEYGGVLVGTADPLLGLVIVTAHEPIPEAFAADTVTFTRETWEYMTRLVITRHPGERIVGWYHSHPRFGIFLSAHDVTIHTTYFAQPWQVAYVFDPVQHERGFFGWADHDIVRIPTWEVTAPMDGISTSLPASVPAHGEFVAARLAAAAPMVDDESESSGPTPAADDEPFPVQQVTVPSVTGASVPRRRRRVGALLVIAAVILGAVIAFAVGGGGDSDPAASSVPDTSTAATETVTTDPASSASSAGSSSAPETTTAPTDASTTAVSTPPSSVLPATPESVTAPGERVGGAMDACTPKSDGAFSPESDCYVALNNGNILVYSDQSLTCADPSGTTLAASVASFVVGVDADPLAVVADDQLVPKCSDIAYAKNVLAGGESTLDGLCGNATAAIDDSTLRCFAQNTTTGAMFALVGDGTGAGALAGSCYAASGSPTAVPITWTKAGVDTSWRVVSVVFDAARDVFVASATRDGVPTTAELDCA